MQAIIQIIALGEVRKGTSAKSGKPWEMQEAECILLNDDGTPSKVGVLRVPRDLMGKVALGTFTGTFSLDTDYRTREIGARLVGLMPYAVASAKKAA